MINLSNECTTPRCETVTYNYYYYKQGGMVKITHIFQLLFIKTLQSFSLYSSIFFLYCL